MALDLGWHWEDLTDAARDKVCQENVTLLEKDWESTRLRCVNCDYPVNSLSFFSFFSGGRTCDLCHTLENSVNTEHFRQAHAQYKQEELKKRNMIKGGL